MIRCCLDLAVKGSGSVSPNPMVGALIERNGEILGSGFHEVYGGNHAEVNALLDARRRGKNVAGATMYVSMEPCVHFGKMAPCVDSIIQYGIAEVIYGMSDPNSLVAGKARGILESSGVITRSGILNDACRRLNERYIVWSERGRPFVALKSAESIDGFIASPNMKRRFITAADARRHVHELRGGYDAVLVGAGTVNADDPELTVRHGRGRNPVRIVLDAALRIPLSAKLYSDRFRTLTIVYAAQELRKMNHLKASLLMERGVDVAFLESRDGRIPIAGILTDLHRRSIASLLVEGGAQVYEEFLSAALVDKVHLYRAPLKLNCGLSGMNLAKHHAIMRDRESHMLGRDTYTEASIGFHRP
ncbi:MAG: bifunctional diaminohydroxyphosphoribosylaminopyrimidine deaminase/5-amino-6-(5-phosphoribosylamino)uracil reductase RibD [Ignavibacteriales bacterium]|nr:bifunctional diaminohydroxyphosphoribosylaminopyrimidine deaminase/5-amino-6-(5-phosphoribosylamino)uracil reductase RibD [Ignavibacteriales bacterium]